MLVPIFALHALAATMATDTESRPAEVRAWLLSQTEPVEVLAEGLTVFADAGIVVSDGRLSYAECIGLDGARLYGDTVPLASSRYHLTIGHGTEVIGVTTDALGHYAQDDVSAESYVADLPDTVEPTHAAIVEAWRQQGAIEVAPAVPASAVADW